MALFRSGALPIVIDTGGYSRPPTPVDDRLCDLCDMGVVENEKHFLLNCPLYIKSLDLQTDNGPFRSGALPIAIETGNNSKPPTPVDVRLV